MAALSWSNPNPSAATAAVLGQAARIDPTNIGQIVRSIISFRSEQAAQQQQAFNNMMAGIAKGAGEEYNIQQQNQANDAANATMYGVMNPNDPYGGFNNPDVVPDYGGTSALRALESARLMGAFETPEQKAMDAARLDALQAEAYNRWNSGGNGTDYLGDFRKQQIINTQAAKGAREALSEELGVTGAPLDAAIAAIHRYKPGVTPFPAIGDQNAISDASGGDYKNAVLNAVQQYDETMKEVRNRSSVSTGIPHDQYYTPTQLNPNDVAQAAARLASEQNAAKNPPYGQDIPPEAAPPRSASTSAAPKKLTPDQQQAMDWAKSHPDDPRSARILQILAQ